MQVKDRYQFKCIHSLHYHDFLHILVRFVGIMLQIPFIILFQISLKISSLCSILFLYSFFYHYFLHTYLQFKLPINTNFIIFELLEVLISHSLMLSLFVLNPERGADLLSSSYSAITTSLSLYGLLHFQNH